MCGRYLLYRSKMDYENALARASGLSIDPERSNFEIPPDYNITPSRAAFHPLVLAAVFIGVDS